VCYAGTHVSTADSRGFPRKIDQKNLCKSVKSVDENILWDRVEFHKNRIDTPVVERGKRRKEGWT
jgi:hypothetical protein